MIDSWMKSVNHMFECAYFEFYEEIYKLESTHIQGSKSGGDVCSLVWNVKWIRNEHYFDELTDFIRRYRDDMIIIPNDNLNITNSKDCTEKLSSKLHKRFEFEIELTAKKSLGLVQNFVAN